jgi:protein-disulfide isomerase
MGFALANPVYAQSAPQPLEDRVLGKADAPITIIEFASLTCPHCATFHREILPRVKQSYIETGKAKLIYRDFPLDQWALRAAMMARCAPAERFFGFIETLYQQQQSWATSSDPMAALVRIGRLGGLAEDRIRACMADEKLADQILASRLEGHQRFKVESTPTIVVNGRRVDNLRSFEDLDRVLKPLAALPDAGPTRMAHAAD